MMSPHRAASEFGLKEGCDLVDYLLVGLPIFRMTVEAITLRRQDLPTIHEFILRSVEVGESRRPDIARLLGLGLTVVEEATKLLLLDGLLNEVSATAEAGASLEVTDVGRERLATGLSFPQDETLVFDYDAICREPVRLADDQVWSAKKLKEEGGLQIRAVEPEPPLLSSFSTTDLSRVIRRISGNEFGKQILALRRLLRSSMMFRPAVGLMFRNRASQEFELAFVLGDALSEQHEIEFARHGGVKKPGFVKGDWDEDSRRLKSWLGPQLWSKISDEVAQHHQVKLQLAKRHRNDLLAQHDRQHRARKKLAAIELKSLAAAESDVTAVRQALASVELRSVAPTEQAEILARSLEGTQNRLQISTEDIDSTGVTKAFVGRISNLVDNKIDVEIETDRLIEAVPRGETGAFEPTVELWSTAQMRHGLSLRQRSAHMAGITVLIQDLDRALITTRSILRARTKPPGFRPMPGFLSEDPQTVAMIRDRLRNPDEGDASAGSQ